METRQWPLGRVIVFSFYIPKILYLLRRIIQRDLSIAQAFQDWTKTDQSYGKRFFFLNPVGQALGRKIFYSTFEEGESHLSCTKSPCSGLQVCRWKPRTVSRHNSLDISLSRLVEGNRFESTFVNILLLGTNFVSQKKATYFGIEKESRVFLCCKSNENQTCDWHVLSSTRARRQWWHGSTSRHKQKTTTVFFLQYTSYQWRWSVDVANSSQCLMWYSQNQ